LLYVPGSALLIPGLAKGSGVLARHLGHPWLKRLGAASFSFYLLQAPILRAARGVFLLSGVAVHSWAAFWAVAAMMFAIVQVSAFITHDRYEMPLQKWLRSPRRAAGTPMRSAYAANTGS
jgi:peptidoglycan/LPS O-acetylase OafA/YrhL